jgi:hypothetical protein
MPITDKRFNDLVGRVTGIGERLAKVEGSTGVPRGHQIPWPLIGAALAIVVTVILSAIAATHIIDTEITNKIGPLEQRLTKVEGAIKALADQGPDQTQRLIHDLLATAKTASDPTMAAKATQAATSLIRTLQEEKRPATPVFFQSSIEALNQITPKIRKASFQSRIALAEYRSALEPLVTGTTFIFTPMKHAIYERGPGPHVYDHINYDFTNVSGNAIVLPKPPEKANTTFKSSVIKGGYQLLDGLHWINVTFVGTHISYNNGELDLQNVRFVNCTFEVPAKALPTPRAERLIDYAALQQDKLSFGIPQKG